MKNKNVKVVIIFMLIFGMFYVGINDDSFKVHAATSHGISMKKFNSSTLVIGKTTDKFKISVSQASDNVTLISSNTSVIQVINYGKNNSSENNSWGLKVLKPGKVTITAQAYRLINGKKKVYNELKYTYTVKAHALSMKKFSNANLHTGKVTDTFKIYVSSPNDNVMLKSSNISIIRVVKKGGNTLSNNKWALEVRNAGKATITAQAYKVVNGKKKVQSETKITYNVPGFVCKKQKGLGSFSGDVNGDGKITYVDVAMTYRIIEKKKNLETNKAFTDCEKKRADINNDGKVTAAERDIILSRIPLRITEKKKATKK